MQTLGGSTYSTFFSITTSDTTLVNLRAIYVGGAGNIALSKDGVLAAVTLTAVPVGTILPIQLDQGRVMATNTTATLLVGLA